MTPVRGIPDLVQWHEGMLLAPQHFQQQSLRNEALLQYQLSSASPFFWGVRRLRIDPVALLSGLFRITTIEAILPDGLVIARDESDPHPLELSLVEHAVAASQTGVAVHLVVPARPAPVARAPGEIARYASYEDSTVTDMNTGDGGLAIPRLRPQPMLIVADAPPEKYVSLPLARVTYRDEAYQLEDFIPPSTAVALESDLGRITADILRRVREKAAFLTDRARATAAAEHEPLIVAQRRLAQSLSCGLPPVEALLRVGVAHPFQVYVALCGLVGHAAGASPGLLPPVLHGYQHANPRASFAEIEHFFDELLGAIREDYQRITFADTGAAFALTMEPAWLSGPAPTLLVGAVPPAGMAESDMVAWLEQAVISGGARLSTVRERRIRGCTRTRVPAPEALGLAPRRGEVIFSIDADEQYVRAGDALQVLHPMQGEQGRPREIVFYAANH